MTVTRRERLETHINALARLRATGPTSTDYARWVDSTLITLANLFGEDSEAVRRFKAAVGQRGKDDAFGLPLRGEWGLWARMERGENVLRSLLSRLEENGASQD